MVNIDCSSDHLILHSKQGIERETPRYVVQSFEVALASLAAIIPLAFSLRNRLSSFPLGFLGMVSINSTPPASRL